MGFKFENLRVFHLALDAAVDMSKLAGQFPPEERFSLAQQMRRAADSVVLNIIEGSILQSVAEFRRFLVIANRSALEVVGCLSLARRKGYIGDTIFQAKYASQEKLVASIQALIKSLN